MYFLIKLFGEESVPGFELGYASPLSINLDSDQVRENVPHYQTLGSLSTSVSEGSRRGCTEASMIGFLAPGTITLLQYRLYLPFLGSCLRHIGSVRLEER